MISKHTMPGHSRSQNGVASLVYVPSIHVVLFSAKTWMPAQRAAMMTERS